MPYLPYLPLLIFGVVGGIVSIYFYAEIKKAGFLLLGIGFILLAVPNLLYVALGGGNLPSILLGRGLTVAEIGLYLGILGLVNFGFQIVFIVLVLAGLFLLRREISKITT